MSNEYISVVIPCYNHGKYLGECIDSVLNQSYQNFEIVIVDDCSTDLLTKIEEEKQLLKDNRISLVKRDTNGFIAVARNTGVENAKYDLIVQMDADCYIHKDMLKRYMEELNKNSGEIIYAWYQNFNNDKGLLDISRNPEWNKKDILNFCVIPFCGMYKKEHWKLVNGYNKEFWMGGEDWNFWIDLTVEHNIKAFRIPEVLMYYRQHEQRVTVQKLIPNNKKMHDLVKSLHKSAYDDLNTPKKEIINSKPETVIDNVITENKEINDLVSVVIPCFNYGKYIDEAVDSVLNQTYKNFEIVIIDDCSEDDSYKDCLRQIDKNKDKIRVFRNEVNKGVAKSRNIAIENALGKYIIILDADDMIHCTYIEKVLNCIKEGKGDIVGTSVHYFGNRIDVEHLPDYSSKTVLKFNPLNCTAIYPKEYWKQIGGYKEEQMYEDWEFWVNMVYHNHKIYQLKEYLFYYRQHDDSRVRKANSNHSYWRKQMLALYRDFYKRCKIS